jgi:hypothetical protein
MERQAIAYLCIDLHEFKEELLLEYAEIGPSVLPIAKERLDFTKQIEQIEGLFKQYNNTDAIKIIKGFRVIVGDILNILQYEGLNVVRIHKLYQRQIDKLETSANLLFDKISNVDHEPDVFDDDVVIKNDQEMGIELQSMKGRNRLAHLPPIIDAPKLNKWKDWRQNRESSKKLNFSKKGYKNLN